MNGNDIKIINQMYATIRTMGVVLNEVSSYNCHGRNEMNKEWTELANMMKELNKPPVIITAEMVKELREQTGEGMMACKNVLVNCRGDMVKAKEYLR